MGISFIILLFGYYIVKALLLSIHPSLSSSLIYWGTLVIFWSILIPINTIINVKIFMNYVKRSQSFRLLLSPKRLIVGLLIMDGVALGIAYLIPFPFSLPVAFIIELFILSRYWDWHKRSMALLLLAIMSIDLVIHSLMYFPYSTVIEIPIGIFIIIWWLKSATPVSGNQ